MSGQIEQLIFTIYEGMEDSVPFFVGKRGVGYEYNDYAAAS